MKTRDVVGRALSHVGEATALVIQARNRLQRDRMASVALTVAEESLARARCELRDLSVVIDREEAMDRVEAEDRWHAERQFNEVQDQGEGPEVVE